MDNYTVYNFIDILCWQYILRSLAIIKQNMDWEKSLAVELSTGEAEMMTLEELETLLAKHNDDANLYL